MTPPAIEPTPWIVAKTPKNEGWLAERGDDEEDQRLGEADDEQGDGDASDDLAQRQRLPDVAEARGHLAR